MVSPCQIQQGATVVEIGLATLVACVPIHFSTEMYSKKNTLYKRLKAAMKTWKIPPNLLRLPTMSNI